MSCAHLGSSSSWTLKRNTSSETSASCEVGWGRRNGSTYINRSVYEKTLVCTEGVVILESPPFPVTVGEKVTLRCFYRKGAHRFLSDFNATFYRDDVFIGSHPEGKIILSPVSKANEGSYKCRHPTAGESPQSLLVVTGDRLSTCSRVGAGPTLPTSFVLMSLPRLLCTILLFVVYAVITILCIHLYRVWARARADAKRQAGL
ncbi:hypothetical protein INR49_006820 [Caranx melampygus]|nr:hypothetical protein INR49_006820 [Caranx melampygus]